MKQTMQTGFDSFVQGVKAGLSTLAAPFTAMWQTAKTGFDSFVQGINAGISTIQSAWNAMTGFFSTLWSGIHYRGADGVEHVRDVPRRDT